MLDRHVTDTFVWIWTDCMAPSGQKLPIVLPVSSATSIVTLSSHSCPGRDCLRGPVGEVSFTVPCWLGRRVHVTRLRGVGRQEGSRGTNSWTGADGHFRGLQSVHDKRVTNKTNVPVNLLKIKTLVNANLLTIRFLEHFQLNQL